MTLLALLIGILLPTLCGWALLRTVEGRTPALQAGERWVMGCVLGLTLFTFCAFLGNALLGVPFSLIGFLGVQAALLLFTGGPWLLGVRSGRLAGQPFAPPAAPPPSAAARWMLGILGAWMLLKLAAGTLMLVATPLYLDDTIDNWNFRGKIFFVDQTLTLNVPAGSTTGLGGISSYPPAVPLVKTWLSVLNGQWSEPLISIPHVLWFMVALILIAYAVRRYAAWTWALMAAYALGSLPLFFSQGVNAYADVFVAAHLLCVLSPLLAALMEANPERRLSLLRVSGVALSLLLFTKNEGVAIYLPVFLALMAGSLLRLRPARADALRILAWWAACLTAIGLPWIGFKWLHGLPFGNAKPISGLGLSYHPEVPQAILINTLFEGNWIFLFPFLLTLMAWRWRAAFRGPLLLLVAFLCLTTIIQWSAFIFTGLATEAIYQTGLARGILQQAPVMVLLGILLLKDGVAEGKK